MTCDRSIYLVTKANIKSLVLFGPQISMAYISMCYINRNAQSESFTSLTLREGENGQLVHHFHSFLHFGSRVDQRLDCGWPRLSRGTAGATATTDNQLRKISIAVVLALCLTDFSFDRNPLKINLESKVARLEELVELKDERHASLFLTTKLFKSISVENHFHFGNRESWKKRFLD